MRNPIQFIVVFFSFGFGLDGGRGRICYEGVDVYCCMFRGAGLYNSMEETCRVTISVGCRGKMIVLVWTRRWEGASDRSRAVEMEVGRGWLWVEAKSGARAAAIIKFKFFLSKVPLWVDVIFVFLFHRSRATSTRL